MNYRNTLGGLAVALLATQLLAGAIAGDFGNEILSNADVISLARAGVTQELILSKIGTSANTFDLSTRGMISLKENGVSDEIIRAMMTAAQSSVARPSLDQTRFSRELENIASGTQDAKTAGIAWILSNREQSLPALQRSLTDPRPETRTAALEVLERLSDRDSLPAIRNLLTDQVAGVRAAAAKTLAELNDNSSILAAEQAVSRQLNPMDGYIRLLGYSRQTQTAGALGNVISSNSSALNRTAAIWALGEIGRAGVAGRPALEHALTSDSDPEVRREAVLAIAKFHDVASATLLQEACRTDPEVRKVALTAMADYPETVEFLIGVMSLGADQIAADELETARMNLHRLTGQDFGLDGKRWSEWFAQNRGSFDGRIPAFAGPSPAAAPVSAHAPPLPEGDTFFDIPGARASVAPPAASQVDLEAWSIVADSSAIPMAPLPQEMPATQPSYAQPGSPDWSAQLPGIPPPGSGTMSISINDFDDSPIPGDPYGPSAPPSTRSGFDSQTPAFRTWNSESERPAPPTPASETARSTPEAPPDDAAMTWSAGDTFDAFAPMPLDASATFDGTSGTTTYTSEPVIPQPATSPAVVQRPSGIPAQSAAPADSTGGISLPLPGMGFPTSDLDDYSGASDYADSPLSPSLVDSSNASFPSDDYGSLPGFPQPQEAAQTDTAASPTLFSGDVFSQPSSDMFADDNMSGFGFPESDETSGLPLDPSAYDISDGFDAPADPYATSPSLGGEAVPYDDVLTPPPPSPALSATTEATTDDWSHLIVDPEPGQQIIGSPLFGPGAPAMPSDGVAAYDAPSSWPDSTTTTTTTTAPAEEAPAALVVTPPYGAMPPTTTTTPAQSATTTRPAPTTPTRIDSRFITPGTDQPQPEEEPTRRRGLFGRRQPRQPEKQARETNLPLDYTATQQMPFSSDDHFTNPSEPLPPVRQGGTVLPGPNKEMPPTLGGGMFD